MMPPMQSAYRRFHSKLFVFFMANLTDVVDRHNVKFHGYADDCQMYVHYQRHNSVSTISRLSHCVTDIG